MTMTDLPRTEYGTVEQTQYTALSPIECQQIVDDILETVKSPNSPNFNPALAAELQIWIELKNRQSDATANAIIDMVRASDKPLHRFFPPSVQVFLGKLDMVARHTGQNGGSYTKPPGVGGGRYR